MDQLTVAEALEELGLASTADLPELTRRYRALARRRHPDAGGDAAAFHRLHAAYRVLQREYGLEEGGTGHPAGRPAAGYVRTAPRPPVSPDEVDWTVDPTGRLTRDRLAVAAAGADVLRPAAARSRGPRTPTNLLVPLLSPDLTSRLSIARLRDGSARVEAELRHGRMSQRLLQAPLPPGWTRERETVVTTAHRTVPPGSDVRGTAAAAATVAADLLERLDWPLAAWRLEA